MPGTSSGENPLMIAIAQPMAANQIKRIHPFVDARAIMHLITGIKVPFPIGN